MLYWRHPCLSKNTTATYWLVTLSRCGIGCWSSPSAVSGVCHNALLSKSSWKHSSSKCWLHITGFFSGQKFDGKSSLFKLAIQRPTRPWRIRNQKGGITLFFTFTRCIPASSCHARGHCQFHYSSGEFQWWSPLEIFNNCCWLQMCLVVPIDLACKAGRMALGLPHRDVTAGRWQEGGVTALWRNWPTNQADYVIAAAEF